MKGLKTDEFIEKSKLIWGNRFDYSLVEYINNNTKVKIICPINGIFEQQPKRHLEGRESKNKRLENKQNFIERANKKFNFKFDYSLVEYKNNDGKVIIICPIHGQFEQCTDDHLNSKYACNDCKKDVSISNKVVKEKVVKEKLDKIKIDRKELFFKRCFEIHGDRYDYSLTEFKSSNDKVKIICREHGIFEQRASAHTSDQGCMECRLEKRRTGLDVFISRCFEIHGDKYDYSLITEYVNSKTKVDIICKKHGVFEVTPDNHTNSKNGCPECKKLGLEKFIEKSNIKHHDKYDYSLIKEYVNNKKKVDIICKEHGIFNQRMNDHMIGGAGCTECVIGRVRLSTEDFIKKSKEMHNNKYLYSDNISFKSNKDKVEINCGKHGIFLQQVNSHLSGSGCPNCRKLGKNLFIEKSNNIHNNKYKYDRVLLNNVNEKVIITCDKHGNFEQRASAHLDGQGCPSCRVSKGELEISKILNKNNIEFKIQYKFSECKNIKELPFDFYLPNYNICIEYNGEQHYRPVDYFGGDERFITQLKTDKIKEEYCILNNILLIVIKYNESVEDVLNEKLLLRISIVTKSDC